MKIIFFGSDDFALVNLERLLKSGHEVVACVTQPDRPRGRGLNVVASPIKERALEHKIVCFQPEDLKDNIFLLQVKSFKADLFVVVAYGKILPQEVLALPYLCAMNVHGSLLPKYRGAAPIHWAVIHGDEETGVSIIKMNAALDAGDIFAQAKIKIEKNDTSATLRQKMAVLGADLLVNTINTLEKNTYTLMAQDRSKVTLAPKLTKELGHIDWTNSATAIHNLARGLLPWPGAYTFFEGKQLKILETEVLVETPGGPDASVGAAQAPGSITEIRPEGIVVAAKGGKLLVKKVHPESSKEMDAKSFTLGYKLMPGYVLGR